MAKSNFADLILKNAHAITCDPNHPAARALAIKGDRILLAGSDAEVEQFKDKNTKIINCQGQTLVPGFNDAHCHIFSFIRKLFSLDLSPASVSSISDIKETIRRKVQFTPVGAWISGSGYNEFYLAENRHPTRRDLDEVSPHHPVIITHRSRHACVLNSLALQQVGITSESEASPGGVIERDLETGDPNGILYEMIGNVRERAGSSFSEAEMEWGIAEANRQYLSLGITSIGEATASNDLNQWLTYRKLKQEGKLQSRICMMPGVNFMKEFQKGGLATGSGDEDLRLGSLKIVLSEATGRLQPVQEDLNRMVLEASLAGFQVAIHAVESSTVEAAITALEYSLTQSLQMRKKYRNSNMSNQYENEQPASIYNQRHRLEHCSECPPNLRQRLSRLPVAIVSQPSFIFYNGERYLAQVPAEVQPWLYPFKSLMESGLTIAGSSDSPIVPHNPLIGIYAAVTRLAESGQSVVASEAISARQALEMYTWNAAFSSCEEYIKGSLSPGKLADIVMLSANPLQSPVGQIKNIMVEMTVLGGRVVWEKNGSTPNGVLHKGKTSML